MPNVAQVGSYVKENWLLVLATTGLLGFVGLHIVWYIHPSGIDSPEELEARITNGQPTVVEYYTNL